MPRRNVETAQNSEIPDATMDEDTDTETSDISPEKSGSDTK
jgi:hypothetical protein